MRVSGNGVQYTMQIPDRGNSESYLIRIYRRDERGSCRIAGLVEIIGEDKTACFRTAGELMEIMGIDQPGERRQKKDGQLGSGKAKAAIQYTQYTQKMGGNDGKER